jgi:RimJ/RimL family protein N-acetyltransferase
MTERQALKPMNVDNTFTFRPLTKADFPMLHEWICRPHVAAWWQSPSSLAEIETDYFPALEPDTDTRAYIVLCDDEPFGFIQSYVVMNPGSGWWEDETDPGARGIDQFIANSDDLNQGFGSEMVRVFVDGLFEDPAVTKVQTDPSPDNARAIRAYEKAGFLGEREVVTPDGPALLMVRYR